MKIFKYKFFTTQKENLKALIISDLHILTDKDNYKLLKIINLIKTNKYDCLFIVGDLIDSTNILKNTLVTNHLIQNLNVISNITPIYLCFGNHDIAEFDYKKNKSWTLNLKDFENKFINILKQNSNIHFLENKPYQIKKGYTLSIINPSFNYTINNADGNEQVLLKEINNFSFLKNLNNNNENILLCHYPNALITLHQKGYLKNIRLSISGHNHNGLTQLKLPIEALLNLFKQENRGFITPNKSLNFKNTKTLRGKIDLDNSSTLIINPAFTSLSHTSGYLNHFDFLFYQGLTEIEFISQK